MDIKIHQREQVATIYVTGSEKRALWCNCEVADSEKKPSKHSVLYKNVCRNKAIRIGKKQDTAFKFENKMSDRT